MIRSLTRVRLFVPAFALIAFIAVHGAAGAYPGDDYTGDYAEPWWIYANPVAETRAAPPPVDSGVSARDSADASYQIAVPDGCGNDVRPIPGPVSGDNPYPIGGEFGACGL